MKNDKQNEFIYTYMYYWQQGDDFAEYLEETNGDVSKALHKWGHFLSISSCMMHEFAMEIDDYLMNNPSNEIKADAYCHHIEFDGPEDFLNDIVKRNMLSKEEVHAIGCEDLTEN